MIGRDDRRDPARRRRTLTAGLLAALAALALTACSKPTGLLQTPIDPDPTAVSTHLAKLTAAGTLGQEPGSAGEAAAMKYAAEVFRASHLRTSTQRISLFRIRPERATFTVSGPTWTRTPGTDDDVVAWTHVPETTVSATAPIVFAGFGIVSPEFNWDDYKNVDVSGKIVLVLDGSPSNSGSDAFGALGASHYSRPAYKYQEAARHGAAGVLLVHDDGQTMADWPAIRASASEGLIAADPRRPGSPPAVMIEGWITGTAASTLVGWTGADFETLRKSALEHSFQPVPLDAHAALTVASTVTPVASQNVYGVVEGQTSQYVLVGARWNRISELGCAGAVVVPQSDDDVSGAAVLLETAQALAKQPKPRRTIVFMMTTATRCGILGSRFYAHHPVFTPAETTAEIFFDRASVFTDDSRIRIVGQAYQGLSDILRNVAEDHQRPLEAERDADRLSYYGWSQAAFEEDGIPEITLMIAHSSPPRTGVTPSAVTAPFNDAAAREDADLLLDLVTRVADSSDWPTLRGTRQ